MNREPDNFNLILPIGTQVVTRKEMAYANSIAAHPRGAVGRIVAAPLDNSHSYQVELMDGSTISLKRHEFSVRKHAQADMKDEADSLLAEYDLHAHVIYSCIVGSRAYGLATDDSDTDRRGIYLAPAELEWSLYGVPEQLENKEREECFWELKKFLVLALKANPNVLECLYTPLVERKTELANELLEMRECFLSQLVYQTYNGYVMSQFKKLEGDLRGGGAIKWKHAMHLIRLLLSGISILRTGTLNVETGEYRARLLAIRRGEVEWAEVNEWRLTLHREFDAMLNATQLPERPDYASVNDFLIKARRRAASESQR